MTSGPDLKRDAGTVDYEIWMLRETSERLRGLKPLPTDEILRRTVLESWLLHLRALLEFFRTRAGTKRDDDVRAEDFFEVGSPELERIRALEPTADSWEGERQKEIHKLLAHIVQDRARYNSEWSERDEAMVTDRLEVFFDSIEPSKRLWFPRANAWFG